MDLVVVFLLLCFIAWLRKLVLACRRVPAAASRPDRLTCA